MNVYYCKRGTTHTRRSKYTIRRFAPRNVFHFFLKKNRTRRLCKKGLVYSQHTETREVREPVLSRLSLSVLTIRKNRRKFLEHRSRKIYCFCLCNETIYSQHKLLKIKTQVNVAIDFWCLQTVHEYAVVA